MMPRRPDQSKGAIVTPENGINRGHCTAGGHQGGIVGVLRKDSIDIQVAATVLADGLYLIDIPPSVYGSNLGYGRELRCDEVNIELFRSNSTRIAVRRSFFSGCPQSRAADRWDDKPGKFESCLMDYDAIRKNAFPRLLPLIFFS